MTFKSQSSCQVSWSGICSTPSNELQCHMSVARAEGDCGPSPDETGVLIYHDNIFSDPTYTIGDIASVYLESSRHRICFKILGVHHSLVAYMTTTKLPSIDFNSHCSESPSSIPNAMLIWDTRLITWLGSKKIPGGAFSMQCLGSRDSVEDLQNDNHFRCNE